MAATYNTKQGDVIDDICHRYYGRTVGAVEAVLEANPGLADRGPELTAGLVVTLPELAESVETSTTTRLWE